MKVLGIDPGTAALGYGIVERTGGRLREVDHGCLSTSADLPLPERLLAIQDCLTELLELHQPTVMAVERLFFSRNVQTAFAVGQARGAVLVASARARVPVREATPSEVKVAVSGAKAACSAAWEEYDTPNGSTLAIAAKCLAGRAQQMASTHCFQVHGGIAFTVEHGFNQWVRRGMLLDVLLGPHAQLTSELGRRLIVAQSVPRAPALRTV